MIVPGPSKNSIYIYPLSCEGVSKNHPLEGAGIKHVFSREPRPEGERERERDRGDSGMCFPAGLQLPALGN